MAIKRVVDVGFWKDSTVIDEYSIEDKYFMLYLYTCPNSELLGMYKLPIKIMSFETGYTVEVVRTLLDRFENKFKIITYNYDTQEIFIKNYIKKSVIKGGKPIYDAFLTKWNAIKSNKLKQEFIKYHSNTELSNKTLKEFISYISNLNIDSNTDDYDNDYDYDRHATVSCSVSLEKSNDKSLEKEVINTYFENQEINDLFNDFLENRKEIFGKKINTSRSIKLLVNKLNDKSDEEKKIMIKKSIENGWKGLFENIDKINKKEIGNTKGWYQVEKDGELSKEEIDEMNEIIKMM